MILKYDLPKNAESMVTLTGDERIYYAVPIDIDEAGNFTTDSVFKENGLEILKINTTSLIPYEEEYYYY